MCIKKILLLSFITGFIQFSITQENLVPNGNFEDGDYNGGTNPLNYYSGGNNTGPDKFDDDIDNWYTAKPSPLFLSPDSPDWIKPGIVLGDGFCPADNSYYVRSASKRESIMVELKNGYKLKKGQTYKFRIKYRHARGWDKNDGVGSFQVVFSTNSNGLRVTNVKNKWVALDVYDVHSCDWKYYEAYFTVPNDNNKNYENMKYLVLQYNHEKNEKWDEPNSGGKASLILHYDDVFLAEGKQCEDIKYRQDWQYVNEHKIEQANVAIHAGAHVSPYSWPANNPVIVKSSAKVIYRAPTVFLEPGFFIEEPGSYFETQVGTCVADPCPQIPSFSPPAVTQCELPVELGHDLPHSPGVFYTWKPESAFETPWSKTTTFNPPTGNGCLNASLTIWTICGKSQTFPFTLKYFDGPPVITTSTIVNNSWQIYFNMYVSNANTYTVQLTDPTTGQVVYQQINEIGCNSYGQMINVNITQCNVDLCRPLELKVIAHNDCYGETVFIERLNAPNVPAPVINVANLVSTDFDLQFDVSVSNDYDYFVVETWDEAMNQLICSQTYSRCGTPLTGSVFHYNVANCLGGCPSKCKNYKIRIRLKNYCNDNEAVEIINWNKTSTSLIMPSDYQNIIVLGGSNPIEALCFNPIGADYYHIVVVDRWGITRFEESGCVTSNPICLWYPSANTMTDVYTYTIEFSNQCGDFDSHHNFVQVYNNLKMGQSQNEPQPSVLEDISATIYVYPNPTEDNLTIVSKEPILDIQLLDNNGKIVKEEAGIDGYKHSLSLKELVTGLYTLKVQSVSGIYIEKVEKK